MINNNRKAQSQFVTYLSVKDNSSINENILSTIIKPFFEEYKIVNFKSIAENSEISDIDFKNVEFSYFYDIIFHDISKNKSDVINIPTKYCITIDKDNCSKFCEKTNIHYDEILLYNQPVFYFIYIDIKDILKFLRTNKGNVKL
ncbi:MAG: hypothetical protein RL344_569 [Pseudomonadota bacterium]|jgi:hypothetical protein